MFEGLRDPSPPRPDGAARGAVAQRAQVLRRRRLTQIATGSVAGALVIGFGTVGAFALTDDDEPATQVLAEQVEQTTTTEAEAPSTTTTTPPTTQAPAVTAPPVSTTAPPTTEAPTTTAPAPQLATLRLSVVIGGGNTLTSLRLDGAGYSGPIPADPAGGFVLADIPPGSYDIEWTVESPPAPPSNGVDIGAASLAGREPITLVAGDNALQLTIG